VRIERPIEQVFAYVSDSLNLPRWDSAVQAVRKTSAGGSGIGSTYWMERELPSGRAVSKLKIVARERPTEFAMRTTSGPTPFHYRYRFAGENGETVVRLKAEVELGGPASVLAPLAGRAIKRGVDANFTALKGSWNANLWLNFCPPTLI
jgi:uncharacterized membrane protein